MKYDTESIQKRKKIAKLIEKILEIALIILIYNIILVSISYLSKSENISIFGIRAYIITTDSMTPEIKRDDVVIVKKCKEEDLKVDDIITFKDGEETITHRIVNIEEKNGKKEYTTKGDNNISEDDKKLSYEDIKGKQILNIPSLGVIIEAIHNQMILLIMILLILIICFLRMEKKDKSEIRHEKKKKEEEKNLEN